MSPLLMLWTASMMIDDFILAGAVHLLALVHWIGGVAMVATIVPPRARYQTCVLRLQPSKRLSADLSLRCASRFCSLVCPASPQPCWQTKVSVGGTSGPTGGARRAAVVAHL